MNLVSNCQSGSIEGLSTQGAEDEQTALRDTLIKLKQQNEQTIDTVTADVVTHQDFDAAAKEKAANLLKSFRDYIEQHQAEITALDSTNWVVVTCDLLSENVISWRLILPGF